MGTPGRLEWNAGLRRRLIRELALGARNQFELAAEFGVTQSAVSHFASRNVDEIATMRERLEEEFTGLWIAEKSARIAEYQTDVESINQRLHGEGGEVLDDKLLVHKLKTLRQTAEELGQLRQAVDFSGRMTYAVDGVDLEKLQ